MPCTLGQAGDSCSRNSDCCSSCHRKSGQCRSYTEECTPTTAPPPTTTTVSAPCNNECGGYGSTSPLGYYAVCDQAVWDATGECSCPGDLDPECPGDTLTDSFGRCRGRQKDCSWFTDYRDCNGMPSNECSNMCTDTVMYCDKCLRQGDSGYNYCSCPEPYTLQYMSYKWSCWLPPSTNPTQAPSPPTLPPSTPPRSTTTQPPACTSRQGSCSSDGECCSKRCNRKGVCR